MIDYLREGIITDIKGFLDRGIEVIISSGCCNDTVLSYREEKEHIHNWNGGYDKTVYVFITSACVFPREIRLEEYEHCDYEEWNGSIFIEIA